MSRTGISVFAASFSSPVHEDVADSASPGFSDPGFLGSGSFFSSPDTPASRLG
ncbi:MAG TPA: hypothetical protein VK471_02315 [Solirubrobacterales bacterium]|nr:hypothetical protein [Solirubrobacterales bacterium]